MPTANRRQFVPRAIRWFQRQTYVPAELIVLDDGTDPVADLMPPDDPRVHYVRCMPTPLGCKRNIVCGLARGELIAHWDDDDWYAPDRLAVQVERMADPAVDICGILRPYYYDVERRLAFVYEGPKSLSHPREAWMYLLCYRKSAWNRIRFRTVQMASDSIFLRNVVYTRRAAVDPRLAVCTIHAHNVSPKATEQDVWRRIDVAEVQKVVGSDWEEFSGAAGLVL